jgi:arylsulfatase A-like enzyme
VSGRIGLKHPRFVAAAAGLAVAAAGAGLLSCRGRPPAAVRVVLITIDTLRHDSFAGGAAAPPLMPRTLARAARGRVFDRAFAATSCTQPSHASMFTGLHPWEHGVTANGRALATQHRRVAQSLQAAGFETFAVVASVPVSARFGFAQGFERFAEPFTHSLGTEAWEGVEVPGGHFYALAETITDAALGELDRARGSRQFLWVHYFDPHSPYGDTVSTGAALTPAAVLQRMGGGPAVRAGLADEALRLYNQDVAALDLSLDRLFRRLEQDQARFETHVVFTADHGESLGEGQVIGHGNHLTPEQVHVPLFILSPRVRAGRDARPTGSVDVAATLQSLAGVEERLGQGSDLTKADTARRPTVGMRRTYDRPFEALRADGRTERLDGYLFYLVEDDGGLIVGNSGSPEAGAPDGPATPRGQALAALFRGYERRLEGRAAAAPLDAETERALRALGYAN